MGDARNPTGYWTHDMENTWQEHNTARKKSLVWEHAIKARQPNTLYINYLSGTLPFPSTKDIAVITASRILGGMSWDLWSPKHFARALNHFAYDYVGEPDWLHGSKFPITFELLPAA